MSAVERFVANQGVLSHYIALKKQESPTSPYHASLKISSNGDFYLQERGSGAVQVYYYVKNFFTRLRCEGVCYFLSTTPPPSANKIQRITDCVKTQWEQAVQEVKNDFHHLCYWGLGYEEMKQKGERETFLSEHSVWLISECWHRVLNLGLHPLRKAMKAMGAIGEAKIRLLNIGKPCTMETKTALTENADRMQRLLASSLEKNATEIRELAQGMFVALNQAPSAQITH